MKFNNRIRTILGILFVGLILTMFIAPEIAEARRGGRSFGGRRSYSKKSSKPRSAKRSLRSKRTLPPSKRTSFGGTRMNSARDYTSKYGTPRKTQTFQGRNAAGQSQKYVMHQYGGYGSSLMTGYMMGTTSWMWMMPFHPAFYYSRPYYVNNADGTMDVYPPRFSFGKLFFTLLIAGGIIFIIVRMIRKRKQRGAREYSQSSFS